MQLHHLVNTFGQDLKQRYAEKVHKLTIHGNFTCPNRDGSLGRGGCTFCNVASFAEQSQAGLSVQDQLLNRQDEIRLRANRYLAYFQAYTSTYAEVSYLRKMYEEALTANNKIVGLCVWHPAGLVWKSLECHGGNWQPSGRDWRTGQCIRCSVSSPAGIISPCQ